jgi:hypothetical protein
MSILDERTNKNSEKYVQNLVINNKNVQKYIIDNLGLKYDGSEKFTKGKTYLNRILPDVKITKNGEIVSLVECKGPNINVTDYVRGIGQLFQYEYFNEQNIVENKKDTYSKNFQTLFFYPSDVLKNNDFNVANFKYPKSTKILQLNLNNLTLREFSKEQSEKFSNVGENLMAISPYYFRDNRLFELYIIIQYLNSNFKNEKKVLSRSDIEVHHLRKFKTPNNNNWRNAFISLSGMGFISNKNLLTESGKEISRKNYPEFCSMIFYDYYKPYIEEIFPILKDDTNIKLKDLIKEIKKKRDNKDILFLTESETRYISSWLNMFRDDFGFLDFQPRQTNRKINYNPLNIEKKELIKNITTYTKANIYLEKLLQK